MKRAPRRRARRAPGRAVSTVPAPTISVRPCPPAPRITRGASGTVKVISSSGMPPRATASRARRARRRPTGRGSPRPGGGRAERRGVRWVPWVTARDCRGRAGDASAVEPGSGPGAVAGRASERVAPSPTHGRRRTAPRRRPSRTPGCWIALGLRGPDRARVRSRSPSRSRPRGCARWSQAQLAGALAREVRFDDAALGLWPPVRLTVVGPALAEPGGFDARRARSSARSLHLDLDVLRAARAPRRRAPAGARPARSSTSCCGPTAPPTSTA